MDAKKRYESPRLDDRGDLAESTLGGGVGAVEATFPPEMWA